MLRGGRLADVHTISLAAVAKFASVSLPNEALASS
jgi:hypothetical protein